MKTAVISLGGSLLIPKEEADLKFLHKFKKELRKNYKKARFVIVTGGGSIARRYIEMLKKEHKSIKELSLAGIRATRMNAQTLMQFFGKSDGNDTLPTNMNEVKSNLHKNHVVICGALRYTKDSTSDGTAAKLAHLLKAFFINMTNVKGLYTSDPRTHKEAKFIKSISWKDFEKMAKKLKFKAGQHFVLDQQAATLIRKHKIPTYIIGPDVKNITKIINNKKFIGTLILG